MMSNVSGIFADKMSQFIAKKNLALVEQKNETNRYYKENLALKKEIAEMKEK